MRDLDEKHLFINSTRYPQSFENIQLWLKHEVEQWNRQYTYVEETNKDEEWHTLIKKLIL